MPVYLLGTFGLLLASHLGSGVAAEYILLYPDGTVFEQKVSVQCNHLFFREETVEYGVVPFPLSVRASCGPTSKCV
jgi:hypothetical protein